jgi:prolyl 4-hydroxylase
MKKVTVRSVDPLTLSTGGPAPELDETTGLPKQLQAFVAVSEPEVLVIPHFLSDAEMRHMLDLAENLWAPSGVQVGNNRQKQVTQARTSYSCIFQPGHTQVVSSVEQKVCNLAGIGIEYLEQLALVRYEPGQFFTFHHDGDHRTKTVFIYLNDLPDQDSGGETVFPELGVQFVPRRGCAVMWNNILPDGSEDSRLVHAGTAPLKGIKYGVNCFFNINPLKARGVIDGDTPVDAPALANTEAQDRSLWSTLDALQIAEEARCSLEN